MAEDIDSQIGRLLRADGVPERDALFRIRLLERGEQQRYRRRARMQWFILVLLVLLPLVLWLAAPDRATMSRIPLSELLRYGLGSGFALALLASAAFSLRGVIQAARWLHRG